MTASEVVSYRLPLGANAEESSTLGSVPGRESFGEFIQRVSDELLWPRILVRTAPPQDGILPNAPVGQ